MQETKQDTAAAFEETVAKASRGKYALRLYVAGSTPQSIRAVAAIRTLCEELLKGRYDLQVVDLYQQPHKAREMQVIAAPTLVKQFPLPLRRLIGDMSRKDRVLIALDIKPETK